jgi:hypothetical protein
MEDLRWENPAHEPLSNGPIRTVTGPAQLTYAFDSDRREMEYLLAFPFHIVDPSSWPPIEIEKNGIPITIHRPLTAVTTHKSGIQFGNEEADAYCTVIRLSTPVRFEISPDDGWEIVKRLLEWIRVKCRHYWLLHGITGFGATYRGTLFVRDGKTVSQQNLAMYGPNVIVNPLTRDLWLSITSELQYDIELPLADSIYCDSLVSIVAGDTMKALLEAGVAMEIALTKLLVDVSLTGPSSAAKSNFKRNEGDRHPFGKKLCEWTKKLGLQEIETFTFEGIPPTWDVTVRELYKLRNGVAHGGYIGVGANFHEVIKSMFAASALLQYCRIQRLRLGLSVYSMPSDITPWQQVRLCHDGRMKIVSSPSASVIP